MIIKVLITLVLVALLFGVIIKIVKDQTSNNTPSSEEDQPKGEEENKE